MDNVIWIFVEICNAVIETIMSFMFVSAFFKSRHKCSSSTLATVAIVVSVCKFMVSFLLSDNVFAIVLAALSSVLVAAVFCHKIQTLWIIPAAVFYVILGSCAELLSALLVTTPQSATFVELMSFSPYRFQAIIVTNFIVLFFIKVLQCIRVGKIGILDMKLWIPLCCLPLFSTLVILQVTFDSIDDSTPQDVLSIIGIVGLVFMNITVFYFVEVLIRRGEKDKLFAVLETQNAIQRERIVQLVENREHDQQMEHDFKHHIYGFLSLCENKQYDALANSMRDMLNINKNIPSIVDTGNLTFDAIVSEKRKVADQNNIVCRWNIQIPPNLALLSVDACAIFGNALDNAIEACLRTKVERFIEFTLGTNRKRLLCVIRNTLGATPQRDGKYLRTAKPDDNRHGIGLRSMTRSVTELGGEMAFEFDDEAFELRISLPLIPEM
ncbi:hypothetical protein FACS1894208_10870 [Clostridia bacterium]|nr:hypothetical protein FACS1894208_10870 [Clostridia bacterium]